MKRLVLTFAILIGLAAPAWVAFAEGLGFAALAGGDYPTALREFRLLAAQGEAEAQFNLGFMYDKGLGVPQDYAEVAKWYRKAAEQGHALAQHNLGRMYDLSRGVPQDYVQAHMWFNLAAARGLNDAAKARELVAALMTPAQIAEAQRQAREWKPKEKGK